MYGQIIVVRIPGKEWPSIVFTCQGRGAWPHEKLPTLSAGLLLGSELKRPRTRDLSLHRLWALGCSSSKARALKQLPKHNPAMQIQPQEGIIEAGTTLSASLLFDARPLLARVPFAWLS